MISFVKTVTRNRKTISKLRKADRDQIMTNRTGVAALHRYSLVMQTVQRY